MNNFGSPVAFMTFLSKSIFPHPIIWIKKNYFFLINDDEIKDLNAGYFLYSSSDWRLFFGVGIRLFCEKCKNLWCVWEDKDGSNWISKYMVQIILEQCEFIRIPANLTNGIIKCNFRKISIMQYRKLLFFVIKKCLDNNNLNLSICIYKTDCTVCTHVPVSLFHAWTAWPISAKFCTDLPINLGRFVT